MDSLTHQRNHNGGIIRRWITNNFCVVLGILLLAVLSVAISIHEYYYDTVQSTLEYRAFSNSVNSFFGQYTESSDQQFEERALEYIENFSEKNLMEVWVIDKSGNVLASTSGFSVDNSQLQDYEEALTAENRSALWTGRNINGEKIMALTVLLPEDSSGRAGALRYIASLQDIDAQFYVVLFYLFAAAAVAMLLVAFSGAFFIRSIVNPVKEINEKAKILAKGDYSAKIEKYSESDEIGELCHTFNEMAQAMGESDRMKNDFISTVSHELRTPLTAIKGWGETIQNADPETVKTGVDIILSETQRLNTMVEDLLDFSKMENGRLTLKLRRVDGFAELEETALVFSERASREGIDFRYDIPAEQVAMLLADPVRLQQIFVNVIDNAFKYSDKLDALVTVNASVSRGYFKVVVSDNGCGISKEDLPHVKEKFYKANISVKGSGIGLAVCDELVRLHNGSLNLYSEPEIGTTVEILLPLAARKQEGK